MNKRLMLGCLIAGAFGAVGPAMAAGPEDWTGFYAGVNGGWGWSKVNSDIEPVGVRSTADFSSKSMNQTINGALFGVQAGYNHYLGNKWMAGIEADFDGASLNDSKQKSAPSLLAPPVATDSFKSTEKTRWLASIRPRVGYDMDNGIAYLTGGVAFQRLNRTSQVNAEVGPGVFGTNASTDSTSTRTGWVVGAGYEWMMAKNWTVRGEFLHYGFNENDNDSATFNRCSTGVPTDCRMKLSTGSSNVNALRVGLNFKF